MTLLRLLAGVCLLFTISAFAQTTKMFTGYSEQSAGEFTAIAEIVDPITAAATPNIRLFFTPDNALKSFNFLPGSVDIYCYRASSLVGDVWCYFLNTSGDWMSSLWQGPFRLGDSTVPPVVGPTMTLYPAKSMYVVDAANPKRGRLILQLRKTTATAYLVWGLGYTSDGQAGALQRLSPPCLTSERSQGCE